MTSENDFFFDLFAPRSTTGRPPYSPYAPRPLRAAAQRPCRWWQLHIWSPWVDDRGGSDPPMVRAQDRYCDRCNKYQRRFV